MRVTQSEFEKIIQDSIHSITQGNEWRKGTSIGITPENERASKNIQLALFKMGYNWAGRSANKPKLGLRSLYMTPGSRSLSLAYNKTAREMQVRYSEMSSYLVLDVTDITKRCSNFEEE